MNDHPEAGWYPDPSDPSGRRYWDGSGWTEQTTPGDQISMTQPIPRADLAGGPSKEAKPWWKRRWIQVTAAAVVGFFVIGGVASALSPQEDGNKTDAATSSSPSATKSAAAPAPTVTVTATPTATRTKEPAKAAAAPTTSKPSATSSTPPAATSWTMPNELGKGLQAAQDDLQVVTDNPLFYSSSTDALGAGRMQLWDRDWKVCSQTPAAGTTFTDDTKIDFSVVKLDESCP